MTHRLTRVLSHIWDWLVIWFIDLVCVLVLIVVTVWVQVAYWP